VFAWYDKRRRPQYCLCSDAYGRLYRVRLSCPDGTVLQVRRAWQGTVLDIAVDLSALSYLLRLLPGLTPSERPCSVVPSRPRPCRSGKSSEQRSWRILGRRKGVEVRLRCHHGQAFWSHLRSDLLAGGADRGPDCGLDLSLCIWAGPGKCCRCATCWAEFCREAGPLGTPGL